MTRNDKSSGGLTERQAKAIPHLVAASTVEKGCRAARISRNQFYQWSKDAAFKAELTAQRDRVVDGALDLLKGHMAGAVAALVGLLTTTNEFLRRSVAVDILDRVLKVREFEDLEKRIASLEEAITKKEGKS